VVSPWDVLDGKAIIVNAGLHEGLRNPLPKLLEDLGEWLADALSGGGDLAAGEVVIVLRRELRFLRPRGRSGLSGEGTREERGWCAAEEAAGKGTGSHGGGVERVRESGRGVWLGSLLLFLLSFARPSPNISPFVTRTHKCLPEAHHRQSFGVCW
jgi:hypothetical protein